MGFKCYVPFCKTAYHSDSKHSKKKQAGALFRFPKDPARRAAWIKAIPRLPPTSDFNWNNARVCHLHFDMRFIIANSTDPRDRLNKIVDLKKQRLRTDAVPSLFNITPQSNYTALRIVNSPAVNIDGSSWNQTITPSVGNAQGSMNALLRYSIQRAPVTYQGQQEIRPVHFTSINRPVTMPQQRLPNVFQSSNIRPVPVNLQFPRPLHPNNTTRPIQPAKQTVQRKTLAFSQVELFQSDVYTEKKTRALLPAIEKAPLRPIADFLEDLGCSVVKRMFPDILDYKPPPTKKRRTGNTSNSDDDDEEYIPESSSDSSDNDSTGNIDNDILFEENRSDNLVAEKFHLQQLLSDDVRYKCESCDFEGSCRFDLAMHHQHGRVNPYGTKLQISCCQCDYSTGDSTTFSQHVLSKHQIFSIVNQSGRTFACHYCSSEQVNEYNLNIHLEKCSQKFKLHENLKPLVSDSNFLFRGHSNSTSFLLGSLSNKPDLIAANELNAETNKLRDRGSVTQLETVTGVCEIIICELCNGLLSNVDSLFQHFVLAHNAHISDTTKRLRIKPFECTDCLKEFWTPMGLFYHRQMKKDRCPVGRKCPYCEKVSSIALIYKHIESQHKSEYDDLVDNTETCLICQDDSIAQPLLKHLNKFHEQGLKNNFFKCPQCAFVASPTNSVTHLRDHMLALGHNYLCKKMPQCVTLKFNSIIELERHDAIDHPHHSYWCEMCGQSGGQFTDYDEYSKHVKAHLRPFSLKVVGCEIPKHKDDEQVVVEVDKGSMVVDDDVVIL